MFKPFPTAVPSCRDRGAVCLLALLLLASAVARAGSETLPTGQRLARTNLLIYRSARGEVFPVKSVRDWQRRRAEILRGMQQIMGPLPGKEKRCPLEVKVEEEVDCGDYVRRFLSYAAEPGSRVPAYLLVPRTVLQGEHKTSGILCLHQTHSLGQKVVVGLGGQPRRRVCRRTGAARLCLPRPGLPAIGQLSARSQVARLPKRDDESGLG